jgi:hypothetical protein
MKNIITLQGQVLTPDSVNVLRAVLVSNIVTWSKLSMQPSQLIEPYAAVRSRAFYLLEVIDGYVPYQLNGTESETISIFIRGALLSQKDAIFIGHALKHFQLGSVTETMLASTGYSVKHFMNLVKPMMEAIVDLLPPDEDDEPIPE